MKLWESLHRVHKPVSEIKEQSRRTVIIWCIQMFQEIRWKLQAFTISAECKMPYFCRRKTQLLFHNTLTYCLKEIRLPFLEGSSITPKGLIDFSSVISDWRPNAWNGVIIILNLRCSYLLYFVLNMRHCVKPLITWDCKTLQSVFVFLKRRKITIIKKT